MIHEVFFDQARCHVRIIYPLVIFTTTITFGNQKHKNVIYSADHRVNGTYPMRSVTKQASVSDLVISSCRLRWKARSGSFGIARNGNWMNHSKWQEMCLVKLWYDNYFAFSDYDVTWLLTYRITIISNCLTPSYYIKRHSQPWPGIHWMLRVNLMKGGA